ncbi:protein CcmA, bactofilin family [Paenibacillus sp. UNC496MF]|uniref:hypothetical protein n=1 Tax=Paenibacillus sp. UNC496MF TaxID=1502753 RepID=UPI0008ECEA82|nr:hypothetical protein [Paenibacillus sp. UNC496MF]SFJ45337.1 protein CcmA, bactofilin family [Paenibacillus sp. UNC496MF]
MHAAMKRNINITGNGTMHGGSFRHVRVMGEAKILGPTECESVHCMGTLDVTDTLAAGRYKQIGEVVVNGDLVGEQLNVVGQLDVQGSVRGRSVRLRGQLDVRGECEAERFEARGGFAIRGLLNAGEVDIRTWGPCRAKEIGGRRVVVRQSKWGGLKQLFSGQGPLSLTAELIEGEYVYLENTTADVVRGANVTIGPGCRIGLVEYRDQLKRLGDARIDAEIRR